MEEFFQQYATYLNLNDIKAFADMMRKIQEGEKEKQIKRNEEFLESCPYRMELVEFSKEDCEKLNIHEKDKHYRITDKKGNPLFGGELFVLGFAASPIDFLKNFVKGGRYIVRSIYTVEAYDESIVSHCKLKSALHFQMHNCVVDKESGEIVYVTKKYVNDYISVYEKILVDEEQRVWYLPTAKKLFDNGKLIAQTEKHILWTEEQNCYSNEPIKVKIINKVTGEVKELE